ncbi:TRAP transporter large permease [Xanthobacter sp. V3C-3]|uniref:TRAP transporter large permease n=1 Tax=Xanthobacter lutulentifluminis TaxID=3119935 RepID=UPI00372AD7FB
MLVVQILGSLIVLLFISVPIAVAIGLISFGILWSKGMPIIAGVQAAFESLDSFSLMAVPFFILAGNIMQAGGISQRLVNLANAFVGWLRGGLGAAAVLTSMIFATISGSSSATTAAIGSTTIPAMEKKGYPLPFATAIVASSGELGVIIPPSLPMIIYALVMNLSITSLFIAGIIPGLVVGGSLIGTVLIVCAIKGYDRITPMTPVAWISGIAVATKDASLALLMPVIILGGIYTGAFTPTEAAVVAAFYALVISLFVYRQIAVADLGRIFIRSGLASAGILFIVAFASAFGFALTINQVPQQIGAWISEVSGSAFTFLLLVNLLLFVVGMFMETLAAIIILAPILGPVAIHFGIDPIHFGMIVVVNLAVGMVTPPVGVNLFVACEIAGLRIDQLIRPLLIFLGVLVVDILIISYVPVLSLALLK